jgi:hypothetical protein
MANFGDTFGRGHGGVSYQLKIYLIYREKDLTISMTHLMEIQISIALAIMTYQLCLHKE